MIRINLLGQPRPRARRAAVPTGLGVPAVLFVVTLALAGGFLWWDWGQVKKQIDQQEARIRTDTAEKARLEQVKREVEEYERQIPFLQQRKNVIEELKLNRVGGQALLEEIATAVTKTDQLWLTSLTRKGATLTMEGTGASMNAVANFITQLQRSGSFEKIELKEARQDDRTPAVQTFLFSLSADFVLRGGKAPASATSGQN